MKDPDPDPDPGDPKSPDPTGSGSGSATLVFGRYLMTVYPSFRVYIMKIGEDMYIDKKRFLHTLYVCHSQTNFVVVVVMIVLFLVFVICICLLNLFVFLLDMP